MKFLYLLIVLLSCQFATAQKTKTDLSKALTDPVRKEVLDAIKRKVQPALRLSPKLVVKNLWVKDGFAYFTGRVKNENGKEIDFRKTAFKEEVEAGVFDGPGTNALLKKVGGKWKVLTYVIGPTDVPWGCWWKEFKAPRELFDYAETDCSWVSGK